MRYFLDIPRIIDGSGAHPGAASPPVEGCGEHGGEESGEPRGARWGAPWGGEWGTPWDSVESAMGRIAERAMGSARDAWGFCTIRRIATACRRRVASLLVQFPPSQRPERAEPNERAGTRHPPRGARREPRGAPRNPPSRWGFCTIRRIATACRRRVASLLVQFPPSQRPERAEPNERAGTRHPPRGARREPRGAPRNPPSRWGFCTIRRIATACRRRVASLLVQFPPRGGEHAGEESGEPSGTRWGARRGGKWSTPWSPVPDARGGHGREARSCPHRQRSGGAPTRTPATRPGNESGQSSFFRSSQRRS